MNHTIKHFISVAIAQQYNKIKKLIYNYLFAKNNYKKIAVTIIYSSNNNNKSCNNHKFNNHIKIIICLKSPFGQIYKNQKTMDIIDNKIFINYNNLIYIICLKY